MKSKVKKRCKQMLTGLLALSMLCGLLPQKYGKRQCSNDGKNKGIFLWKIRKCRCRFKDENGNMVENQCWQ